MTSANLPSDSEQELGYGQIFAVIWRRRFWFLGAFLVVLPITSAIAFTRSPEYQSSLQLLVEPNYQGKENNRSSEDQQFTDNPVQIDYATQLNLLRSTQLIQKAVNLLKSQYPDLTVKEIRESLVLSQVEGNSGKDVVATKIFQADYIADDPVKAQAVLVAMQKVYQDYNLEQQKLRVRNGLSFIDEQLPEVVSDVSQAEGALEQFRESANILDPASQGIALADALEKVRTDRQALDAQLEDTSARFEELQTRVGKSIQGALVSTRLSQSERYQSLQQQIQAADLAIAERKVTYTENDPGLIALLEQKQELLNLLQAESRRIVQQPTNDTDPETLLSQGNLGELDVDLVQNYIAARVELLGLVSRDRSLAQTEQQLVSQLSQFPSLIAEYNRLQPEVDVKRQSLEELLKARQDLSIELARGGFNWQVIESPQPGESISPSITRDLLLGGIVALFLGGIAAFLREAMDDSVHTSEQLGEGSALPLLGIVPELTHLNVSTEFKNSLNSSLTPQIAYSQTFRESVDLVYKNIQLISPTANSIVVTSALANEGKTTLALGLTLSAARSQQRVLLIDADLRKPSVHEQLNLPNDKGLTNLLENDFRRAKRHQVSLSNCSFDVLTSGPIPDDPVQLLSSGRLQHILSLLEQRYDQIIIDAPPLSGLVDAIQISSCCQGVVMVGRLHQISQSDLSRATQMLKRLRAIGIVANGSREVPKGLSAYTKSISDRAFVRYDHPERELLQHQQSNN